MHYIGLVGYLVEQQIVVKEGIFGVGEELLLMQRALEGEGELYPEEKQKHFKEGLKE